MKKTSIKGILILVSMIVLVLIFSLYQEMSSNKSYIRKLGGDEKVLDSINLVYNPNQKNAINKSDINTSNIFNKGDKLTVFTSKGTEYVKYRESNLESNYEHDGKKYKVLDKRLKYNVSIETNANNNSIKLMSDGIYKNNIIVNHKFKNPSEFLYDGYYSTRQLNNAFVSNVIESDGKCYALIVTSNIKIENKDRYKAKMVLVEFDLKNKKFTNKQTINIESKDKRTVRLTDLNTSIYDAFGKIIIVYKMDGKIYTHMVEKNNSSSMINKVYEKNDKNFANISNLLQDNIEYDISNQFYSDKDKTLAVIYNKNSKTQKKLAVYRLDGSEIKLKNTFKLENGSNEYFNESSKAIRNNGLEAPPDLYSESNYYRVDDSFIIMENLSLYVYGEGQQIFDSKCILVEVYDINTGKLKYLGSISGNANREALFESYNMNIMPSIKK